MTCLLCNPPAHIGTDILNHLRLLQPTEYGDGPEHWPDGQPAIYDDTADTPADLFTM